MCEERRGEEKREQLWSPPPERGVALLTCSKEDKMSARGRRGECIAARPDTVLRTYFTVSDFEEHARTKLDANAWGYYSSGADEEHTLRDNQLAFTR